MQKGNVLMDPYRGWIVLIQASWGYRADVTLMNLDEFMTFAEWQAEEVRFSFFQREARILHPLIDMISAPTNKKGKERKLIGFFIPDVVGFVEGLEWIRESCKIEYIRCGTSFIKPIGETHKVSKGVFLDPVIAQKFGLRSIIS